MDGAFDALGLAGNAMDGAFDALGLAGNAKRSAGSTFQEDAAGAGPRSKRPALATCDGSGVQENMHLNNNVKEQQLLTKAAATAARGQERVLKAAAAAAKKAATKGGRWTKEEDDKLRAGVSVVAPTNWKRISDEFLGAMRSEMQCSHRWQHVLRPGIVKGPWTTEEDDTVIHCINAGITKWSEIAQNVPGRIGKQCRERWFNHLDPSILKVSTLHIFSHSSASSPHSTLILNNHLNLTLPTPRRPLDPQRGTGPPPRTAP